MKGATAVRPEASIQHRGRLACLCFPKSGRRERRCQNELSAFAELSLAYLNSFPLFLLFLNNYRPCGNVCELCDVLIWRAPRSSRVSRDSEKTSYRFLDFGSGAAPLGLIRSLWSSFGKTGFPGVSANLVMNGFIIFAFRWLPTISCSYVRL